ncbi:MAG: hypothetical protein J6Y41_06450 [Bacteroidaceae bacterium]|nr:hypothetical protein [Bacteroidaceae bacterium]MBP5522950.1 hypothetical protein [Bacteroidaceae bacterium]
MMAGKEEKERKSFDLIDEFLEKYGAGLQAEKELVFDYKSNDYTSYLETMEADIDVVAEMKGEELINKFIRRQNLST